MRDELGQSKQLAQVKQSPVGGEGENKIYGDRDLPGALVAA